MGLPKSKQAKSPNAVPFSKPKMTKEERRKKYTDIARKRREKQYQNDKYKNAICFLCRRKGHSVSQCPDKETAGNRNNSDSTLCFKCGSTEHSLAQCPQQKGRPDHSNLPFATCFLCNEKGHLVSACPKNQKGIYVNGGCCRHCGSTQHLSKDCAEKASKAKEDKKSDGKLPTDDIDDLLEEEPAPKQQEAAKPMTAQRKKRVVKM
eukprot:Nitzschia sp. Nitz4//scaffold54_size114964//102586//103203//NITZ4_003871-RA/size114964-processed-gene-0.48-mRNA-1//1//CDS//3329554411//2509//frame0